ncbi:MAG: hypothetical protein IJ265_09635 [Oscillospiraceae bacterium]|nr:hypothetical protein [Oscillospiraceae bacterium]
MTPQEELFMFKKISEMADRYVPMKTLLQTHGMTFQAALAAAETWKKDFWELLERHHIHTRNLLSICIDVMERVEESPENADIQRLYCTLLTECGLLFGTGKQSKEVKVRNYFRQKAATERLMQAISEQKPMRERLEQLRQDVKQSHLAVVSVPEEEMAVYRLSLKHQELSEGEGSPVYADNVAALVQQVNSHPAVRNIKPFLLFAALHRKGGYLLKREHFQVNLENLLESAFYHIEKDNGKNFKDYRFGVELYEHFRRLYAADASVDLAFSDYCFANLTNLSEWYYGYCEPNEEIPMTLLRTVATLKSPLFPMLRTDAMYKDFDMEIFRQEHPSLVRKFWRVLEKDHDLVQAFVTALYYGDDRTNIVRQLCEKVGAYNICDRGRAEKAAEIILYQETEQRLADEMIYTAENWMK